MARFQGKAAKPETGSDERRLSATLTEIVFPEHTNHYGTLFGGNALLLMSKAAFLVSSRYALSSVVLAGVEAAQFKSPVRLGETVLFHADIVRVGRTSMSVNVYGEAEDTTTGASREAMKARFEMIAVDEKGRPRPIAEITKMEGHA